MKVVQAYRFALDLTAVQERAVLSHCGAARVAYNWGLARVRAVADQRTSERSYGIAEPDLTPAVGWSLPALRRAWDAAEGGVAPWWAECSKEAYNTGLGALARALKNWSDSRSGKRQGRPIGLPRFKSRRRCRPAVPFTTGTIRVECDRKHVTLPRLGRLKTHESTRKLARRIEAGLAATYGTIVIEDLNIAGMLRNRRLARSIADAGFGEVRRQLTYKTRWHGGRLIVADRWYPSSKTCCGCGAVKAKLPLSTRTYTCTACGLSLDRDLNAARNLAALTREAADARSGRESSIGRRADQKTRPGGPVAMKRRPGTATAGKTGSVPPQGGTSQRVLTEAH